MVLKFRYDFAMRYFGFKEQGVYFLTNQIWPYLTFPSNYWIGSAPMALVTAGGPGEMNYKR